MSENIDTNGVYAKLLESSLRYFSFRPRSEKEIRGFLQNKLKKQHVYGPTLVDKVITRLRELGYVDDEKFVVWWIDQRHTHKPKGMRLIAQELKAKGISDDLVKFLLVKQRGQYFCGRNFIDTDDGGAIDDEVALARRAVEKKLPLWQTLPKLEQKKKIYGFLGRRGFDGDTIHHIIDELDGRGVQ